METWLVRTSIVACLREEGKYGNGVAETGICAIITQFAGLASLEDSMKIQGMSIWFMFMLVLSLLSACQREAPAENASSQPATQAGSVEDAVRQTVDGIKGPMDKARTVEGTLEKAAERTAEQVQGATQ
jgi:hypothetical protein